MRFLFFPLLGVMLLMACNNSSPSAPPVSSPPPLATADATTDTSVWRALEYASAPADNPLKGFMPFYDAYGSAHQPIANDFPHSMEWFYVPLRNLMNGPDSFTFDTGLEPQLNSIAARGHQAVFRVYLDYPGRQSGIPQFLRDDGLKVRQYTFFGNGLDDSVSPDYDDPRLMQALENFIAALGKRYDGDPRIGFITVGLVGFWGEWHTWPQDGSSQETSLYKAQRDPNEENWMPSEENQLKILQAWDDAFDKTRLLVRYPVGNLSSQEAAPKLRKVYGSTKLNLGYHDDSFAYETAFGEDWFFLSRMQWRGALDTWQREPIGGELRPEIQLGIWLDPPRQDAEDYDAVVDATHASWLIAHAIFTAPTVQGKAAEKILAGAKRLGYEFYVPAVRLTGARAGQPLQAGVRIQNLGVAPFYYPWQVQLGALDGSNKLVATWDVPWDLRTILPASAARAQPYYEFTFAPPNLALNNGTYTLVMRVVNPLPNGKSLQFANTTQDQDLKDWLTLGTFTVEK